MRYALVNGVGFHSNLTILTYISQPDTGSALDSLINTFLFP
jgi:hypothetical protein